MEKDKRVIREHERPATTTKPRSYLFAVRLWKEEVAGGAEYRGNVRAAIGTTEAGAFCNFRDWSELVTFMCTHIEEDEHDKRLRTTLADSMS